MRSCKRIIIFILIFNILLLPVHTLAIDSTDLPVKLGQTGKNVYFLQSRLVDLGYLHFRPSGYFGEMTKNGLKTFQGKNWISKSGQLDIDTYTRIYAKDAVRASASAVVNRVVGPRTKSKGEKYGEQLDWKEVSEFIPVDSVFIVQDLYSGISFNCTRTGGENHIHFLPYSESDMSSMLKCFGGQFTWEKRPVVVTYREKNIAASLFGYPNGTLQSKKGDLNGDFCLYFSGSTAEFGNLSDAEHVANILTAAIEQGTVK